VTSYERRGRADGPAFDRGNFTTAAPEKQHLPVPALVARASQYRRGPRGRRTFLNAE
jgi:hypothetical protein